MIQVRLILSKKRLGSNAVYCPQCDEIIADDLQPMYDMSKSKWLHENGTAHKPVYCIIEVHS